MNSKAKSIDKQHLNTYNSRLRFGTLMHQKGKYNLTLTSPFTKKTFFLILILNYIGIETN